MNSSYSQILPVATYGIMTVYERIGYRKLRMTKYVVYGLNKALEEFRTLPKALSWAKKNQNG